MLELQNITINTDIQLDKRLFDSGSHINGRQEKVFISRYLVAIVEVYYFYIYYKSSIVSFHCFHYY
jgi:hypothetical protein